MNNSPLFLDDTECSVRRYIEVRLIDSSLSFVTTCNKMTSKVDRGVDLCIWNLEFAEQRKEESDEDDDR